MYGNVISKYISMLLATSALTIGVNSPAMAQYAPALRPSSPNVDENGIDVISGNLTLDSVDLSVGAGSHPMALVRRIESTAPTNLHHNFFIRYVSDANTHNVQVQMPDKTKNFTYISGNQFKNNDGTGETFSNGVYTDADGAKYEFEGYTGSPTINTMVYYATKITYPDGYVVNLSWDSGITIGGDPGAYWFPIVVAHLTKVQDNIGQSITFSYKSNSTAYPVSDVDGFNTLASATIYVGTAAQQSVNYTWANDTLTATLSSGDVKTYAFDSTSQTFSVTDEQTNFSIHKYPSNSSTPQVVSKFDFSKEGSTSTYTYSGSGSTATALLVHTPGFPDRSYSLIGGLSPTGGRVNSATVGGVVTTYGYDSSGRLTDVAGADGSAHYEYDARGNQTLARVSPKSGSSRQPITTQAGYSASCANASCNKPVWTRDAAGNQTDYTYDTTTGQVLTILSPAPNGTSPRPLASFTYQLVSGVSVPATISTCATAQTCAGSAQQQIVRSTFDSYLRPVTVTTASGDQSLSSTVTTGYDVRGNVTSIDGPLAGSGDTTVYRYNADRELVGIVSPDPDGAGALKPRAQRITRDSAGRVTAVEIGNVNSQSDADWAGFAEQQQSTVKYDGYGRKTLDVVTAGSTVYRVVQYSYDSAGRLECTAVRMNNAVWGGLPASSSGLPVSACTLGATGTFGPDRISRNFFGTNGMLSKVQIAYGTSESADSVTEFYDTSNHLVGEMDGNGNKTSYSYDDFGRPWKVYYPLTTLGSGLSSTTDYTEIGYDDAGRVASRRLRDGQTIAYTYDHLNRVTLKNLPGVEPDVTYGYDLLGRMTSASQSGNALSFGYDALGRNTSQGGPQGTVSYQYDLAGNRTRMTWPDNFYVTYDHLVTGEVSAIRENGAASGVGVLATYGYDDLGRRTTITRGNGTVSSYGYDNASQLASLTHNLAGTAQDVTTTFGYMPSGQIASQTRSNDTYAWTGHYNVTRDYTVNGLNQTTVAGSTSIGYDARGNLTSSGGSTYGYSSENLLTSAPGVTLAYDPLLRLYQTSGVTVMRFAYDGADMIAEYSSAGAVQRRYVHGPSTDEPIVWYEGSGTADRRWLHADERGSIVSVTNSSGAVITNGINSYDEYGIPGATNAGRFQYTGQAWVPELGMYYYKARIYSPTLGRFMQTDPIGYGDGMNLYAYVGGDPINSRDPGGLQQDSDAIIVQGHCKSGDVLVSGHCENLEVVMREAERRMLSVNDYLKKAVGPPPAKNPYMLPQNRQPACGRGAASGPCGVRKKPISACMQGWLGSHYSVPFSWSTPRITDATPLPGMAANTWGDLTVDVGSRFNNFESDKYLFFHEIAHFPQWQSGDLTVASYIGSAIYHGGNHDSIPYEVEADYVRDNLIQMYNAEGKPCG